MKLPKINIPKNFEDNKDRNYTHFCILPLQLVGAWDWYPKPVSEWQIIVNYTYLGLVLIFLIDTLVMLLVNVCTDWVDPMSGLEKLADGLPYVASLFMVSYFACYKRDLYDMHEFMNRRFKYHSAWGLTNMNMGNSYKAAKLFCYAYTMSSLSSSWMYALAPLLTYLWTNLPPQNWFYMDITHFPYIELTFLRQFMAQTFMGLALGQLGVFYASHSILICGQLDLLCCSLRNARFTALLKDGVQHGALKGYAEELKNLQKHNFLYNEAVHEDSLYNYNEKINKRFKQGRATYDIYSSEFDASTEEALRECAELSRMLAHYKQTFQTFASPLLVVRVVQVTLFLCILLYSASRKLNMVTVEYLMAVAFDIFIYCYYGNQIIIQASRVSTSAYESWWETSGVRARRLLLHILLANKRPMVVRAAFCLPMNIATYRAIIKTSFSYYTLLANVNERKNLH